MPPIKPLRKFNTTIAVLYSVCRLCWNSCLENLAAFTAFRTIYDAAFVADALAAIDAAEALPNEDARALVHESLHVDLVAQGEICLTSWRKLRAYIKGSFSEEYYEMNLEAAGGNYYETAIHENWEDMQQMLVAGKQFITANSALLLASGMPAAFPASYDGHLGVFTPLYNSFKDAQMDSEAGTIVRLNANNAVYDSVQAMNFDGQTIFENDPERYDRFVFARVKDLVSTAGGTATTELMLRGVVKNGGTLQPMHNIEVALTIPGAPVQISLTDALGKYEFHETGMEPGTISATLTVETPGFEIYEKTLSLTIGNTYTEDVIMVPGENILSTFQGFVAAGLKVNLGTLPEGTTLVRMKALDGGPLEFGLSADGLNFNGNTTTMGAGAETTYLISDFASSGTTFVVYNQNGSTQGEYKVEFIG